VFLKIHKKKTEKIAQIQNKTPFKELQDLEKNKYDHIYEKWSYFYFPISFLIFFRNIISRYSIRRGESLLDIGCGEGYFSNILSKLGLEVTGVDISKTGINIAKKRYGDKITWIIGDALELKFQEKFDIILCAGFSPFSLISDLSSSKAKSIRDKLFSYLKKGGLFIFYYPSDLSSRRSEDGWMNFSINQIREYFLSLPNTANNNLYLFYPPMHLLLGRYALSRIVTNYLKKNKIIRYIRPVIILIILKNDKY